MLYTITPEEEKAALHQVTHYIRDNYPIDILKYSSLAEMMNDSNLSPSQLNDRHYVVLTCMEELLSIIGPDDTEDRYTFSKALYEKYANQNLFGAIGGLSLTTDHFNELMLDQSISLPYKQNFFFTSLFFDFATKSHKFNEFLDDFIEKNGPENNSVALLLFPFLYKFTEAQVQNIIVNEQIRNPGSLIFFAACPYTKNWLTKTNFSEEYKSLMECSSSHGYKKKSIKELSIAYQDLFAQDFTNVALEAIKELDNYRDLSREFDYFNYLNHHQFEIHSELLRLNYTPYSDDHYKYMVNHYRNNSYIHDPSHLTRLAKSPKTKDLLIRQDFIDCLNKNDYYDEFFINELSQVYQDLFGEELIFDSYQS